MSKVNCGKALAPFEKGAPQTCLLIRLKKPAVSLSQNGDSFFDAGEGKKELLINYLYYVIILKKDIFIRAPAAAPQI
jgi:hypothetical protein